MKTGLRERVRWLVPTLAAVVALGTPGIVSADTNVVPSVTATVSNASPVEPQTVVASAAFTDPESDVETYTCSIDYGDGTVVAGVISGLTCTGPTHQYLVSGTYSVAVTVTDGGGASGTGTSGATYQNWAPWVGGGLVGSFVVGSPVHDVAAVVDPGVAFETYTCTVDYGDGSGVQGGTYVPSGWSDGLPRCVGPDHIYNAPGSYSIVTTATDNGGETGSSLVIETIIANFIVVGPVSAPNTPSMGSSVSASATFTPTDSQTYTCTVDYGDGGGAQPGSIAGTVCAGQPHTYGQTGPYIVTVRITDSNGLSGSNSTTVMIDNMTPQMGSVVAPAAVLQGQPFVASASFTDDVDSGSNLHRCAVDFGAGWPAWTSGWISGSACVGPNFAYPIPGTFTLTITVTDKWGATASAYTTVVVGNVAPVVQNFLTEGTPAVGGVLTAHATFHDPALGLETYTCSVDFGDGTAPQAGVVGDGDCTADHTYSQGGLYAVTVTVTDGDGGSGSVSGSVAIAELAPTVGPITVSGSLIEGGDVQASAAFTDPWSVSHFSYCVIDYGDGSGMWSWATFDQTCVAPTHNYALPGTFTVRLSVDRGYGEPGTNTTTVTVVNLEPVVAPVYIFTLIAAGASSAPLLAFDDPGVGLETYYCTIDYGDGGGAKEGVVSGNACTGPDHSYASKGTYTLVAAVTDSNGGTGTYSVPITVYNPEPTVGAISAPVSATVGTEVTASAAYVSTGLDPADTCTVDYGDGTGPLAGTADGATCTGPSHTYASVGTFTITVTILSAIGSTASSSATIQVYSLLGAVSVSGTLVEGSWAAASATFTPIGRQTYKCTVNYGDGAGAQVGAIISTTCRGPGHKYAIPGDYTITVAVTGSKGYSGSASVAVSVINAVPGSITPSFAQTMLKLGSTATLTVRFVDPGTGETYTGLVYWGDGTQSEVTVTGATRQFSVSHRYASAGCYFVWVSVAEPDGGGEMVNVPTMPNAPDASIVIYDPARTVSGSGKLSSPFDACLLNEACRVASTASFSLSARYAAGATKPTVTFSYKAAGFSFTATSADLMVASQGRLTIRGAGKVNGVSGFSFLLVASDETPDTLWLLVENARTGETIYQGVEGQPLLSGSISIR